MLKDRAETPLRRVKVCFGAARPPRRALLTAALAVVAGLGLAACAPRASQGVAAVGGPFHLVDQNGAPTDARVLDGKWSTVFFGYTF